MSNVLQRILTGLVGIPLVLGVIYLGGWPFVFMLLIVAWAAQHEFYKLSPGELDARHIIVGFAGSGLVVLYQFGFGFLMDAAVLLLVVVLVVDVFDRTGPNVWQQTTWMLAGIVYPALLFSYLVRLRTGWTDLPDLHAFYLTIAPLLMVWSTDTLAYFVGRSFGKRPLAPAISPKKTWEGTLGGFFGALLAAAILKATVLDFIAWPHIVALGAIAGVGGQVGDLIESRLKRLYGVKDSGAILPGHGGLLDRIDSLLVVVPLFWLYVEWIVFGP